MGCQLAISSLQLAARVVKMARHPVNNAFRDGIGNLESQPCSACRRLGDWQPAVLRFALGHKQDARLCLVNDSSAIAGIEWVVYCDSDIGDGAIYSLVAIEEGGVTVVVPEEQASCYGENHAGKNGQAGKDTESNLRQGRWWLRRCSDVAVAHARTSPTL